LEAQLRKESAKLKNANKILEEEIRLISDRETRETTRLKTEIEAVQVRNNKEYLLNAH
jgi:hypothetical protein